ncbi:MAG: hypothetical protein DRJ42_25265 [Deltaproteobacteria bacterium]|nr:MAG: hypothetical protein DRJ42_25265 [Deltaproteobacteria bacterium]
MGTDATVETDSSILDAAGDAPRDASIAEDAGDTGDTSPVGSWLLTLDGGYWNSRYSYEITGSGGEGNVVISGQRVDLNGALNLCTRLDEATASWTVHDGIFDVVMMEGRTQRRPTNVGDDCGIGEDMSYDERDMTAEELGHLDFANGPFRVEGDLLTTTTFYSNGSEREWSWRREP